MAANISVTPGSGKDVLTDEVGGFQIQGVKVFYGNSTTGVRAAVGAGAVDTGTPRYTHASDDPLVTAAGAVADAAWSSGSGSIIAILKAIAGQALSAVAQAVFPLPTTPVSGLTAAMTSTTSTAVTGVGAASGKNNYITGIVVGNSHATVGTFVELQDGSGGTTFFTLPAAAVYGGATFEPTTPIKQPTANTALYAKNTTTGANVIVSVVGFQA